MKFRKNNISGSKNNKLISVCETGGYIKMATKPRVDRKKWPLNPEKLTQNGHFKIGRYLKIKMTKKHLKTEQIWPFLRMAEAKIKKGH